VSERVTISGRAANLLQTRLRGLANAASRRHAEKYARSGGTKATSVAGKPVFRLVVAGRTSGEPRPVMLMLVRRGSELVVCGSQGGHPEDPNWWKNLVAAGHAVAQVGTDTFPVTFRVVTDPSERDECWQLLTAAYPDFASYQALTKRLLPIGVLTPA
jgi:deazaflavin-dependent oxidoreductase (nitroreductase family)